MPKNAVIMGIGGYLGHDANAALMIGPNLISSSQEERFTRKKHDGAFPSFAIEDCLAAGKIDASEVTDVVFAEKSLQSHLFDVTGQPGGKLTRWLGRWLPGSWPGLFSRPARQLFPNAKFHYAWHHLTHVAGAFHTSPFESAAFLCVDGKGEDYSASAGIIDDQQVTIQYEQPYENGLGMLYTLVTEYLGFHSFGSEYKVMGLAPYGRPVFVEHLERLFATDDRGGLRLKAPIRFSWESRRAAWSKVAEATGLPVRQPKDELTSDHINIARRGLRLP